MVLALGHILASQAYDRLYLENFIHYKIDNQLIDDQDIQETNRKLYIIQQKSSLMNNFGRYVGNAIPGNISLIIRSVSFENALHFLMKRCRAISINSFVLTEASFRRGTNLY